MSSPVIFYADDDEDSLRAFPDEDFSHKLQYDPAAAALHLRGEYPKDDSGSKRRLISCFCSIIKFAEEQPAGLNVLLRHSFAELITPILTMDCYDVSYSNSGFYSVNKLGVACLYMAVRAFSVCLRALWVNNGGLDDAEWLSLRRAAGDRIRPLLPGILMLFWNSHKSVLGNPVDSHPVNTPFEETPQRLGDAMADCVIEIGNYYEAIRSEILPRTTVDLRIVRAYMLFWLYCARDPTRGAPLFLRFYQDLRALGEGSVAMMRTVLSEPRIKRWFFTVFRQSLLRRSVVDRYLEGLLTIFFRLGREPVMISGISEQYSKTKLLIWWVMKAMQRQLCMGDEKYDSEVLTYGLPGILRWSGSQKLNMMETIHSKVGVPLLPYLGRLSMHVIRGGMGSESFRMMLYSCGAWAQEARRTHSADPFITSDIVRRAWLKVLQELKTLPHDARTQDVVNMWVQYGRQHGFQESDARTWLPTHPSQPPLNAQPWEYCAWAGCMCHEQKPLFSLRGCNGCFAAYYCSRKCQRRDWDAGHQKRCLRD